VVAACAPLRLPVPNPRYCAHPGSPLLLPLIARKSIVTMCCDRDAVVTQEQSWRVEIGMCPGYTKDIASKDPTVRFLPLILASVCVFFLLMAALVRQVYKYHLSKVAITQEQWAYVPGDATLSGVRACGRLCAPVFAWVGHFWLLGRRDVDSFKSPAPTLFCISTRVYLATPTHLPLLFLPKPAPRSSSGSQGTCATSCATHCTS
jgi:hypothetical protein